MFLFQILQMHNLFQNTLIGASLWHTHTNTSPKEQNFQQKEFSFNTHELILVTCTFICHIHFCCLHMLWIVSQCLLVFVFSQSSNSIFVFIFLYSWQDSMFWICCALTYMFLVTLCAAAHRRS